MQLKSFQPSHINVLKGWFANSHPGNGFITFYAQPENWLKLVDNKNRFALAVTQEDKMIGFADVELEGKDRASIAFGLDPHERGKGLGRQLVSLLEDFAREHGTKTLVAGVENTNTACTQLLEASGFSATHNDGELTSFVKDIG